MKRAERKLCSRETGPSCRRFVRVADNSRYEDVDDVCGKFD